MRCVALLVVRLCLAARIPRLEPVTSEDVARYFSAGKLDLLHDALADYFGRTARTLGSDAPVREVLTAKGAGNSYASAYKLDHDVDQFRYLATRNATVAAWLEANDVLARYGRVRARIPPVADLERTKGLWAFRPDDVADIGSIYNRAVHAPDPEPVGAFLNAASFADADDRFSEGPIAVDDALTPEAFAQLRSLLLESTVFFETKMPEVFGGYVGAIIEDGLHARPFLALAKALTEAMPETFAGHPLTYCWCYKYDSDYDGIKVHADEAAVNVNLWLTPDDANLDPASGGLVVYTAKPDAAENGYAYNARGEEYSKDLLEASGYANVTVPYRANRIVIFDSALYHKTDTFHFKKGYENRRINLTLLFGTMRKASRRVEL